MNNQPQPQKTASARIREETEWMGRLARWIWLAILLCWILDL